MKPNLPPLEIPPKVPDNEMDKLKRQIWELQQQLKAYGKSADWSDQVDLIFSRQHKVWSRIQAITKRMEVLEELVKLAVREKFPEGVVDEILDKLRMNRVLEKVMEKELMAKVIDDGKPYVFSKDPDALLGETGK